MTLIKNERNDFKMKFNLTIILIFMSFFGVFQSKAQVNSKAFDLLLRNMIKKTIPTISVAELKPKVNKVMLLDARETKEYEVSHLKNARNVGFENFDLKQVSDLPKDAEIVVYCSIGVRSEKIGEKLKAAGFTNVKNLYGSIFEWVNQGNTVYDSNGKPTLKVHTYSKSWGMWLNKGEKVY